MALPANKKTGTANVGILAVYFLKHQNGVEPVIKNVVDSPDWFPVLTRRGTVNVSQDNPSMEKVLVDQFDAPIGMDITPGDFTIEAQLPSLLKEDLEKWLENELEVVKDDSNNPVTVDGRQLIGFNLDGKIYEMSVLIQTKKGSTIIFSNVQLSFLFSYDENVFQTKISGQVLAAQNEANKMIYVATERITPVTGITLNKNTTSIVKDETETLTATIAPVNATDKGVTWTSSDESKATVDENGVVTAIAAGSATITATANGDSTKTATCAVTVTNS